MTQSFDEWDKWDLGWKGRKAYEAGAQSKQAEIDEYKEVASSMEDAYLREKSKVDELRKKIDERDKLINDFISDLDKTENENNSTSIHDYWRGFGSCAGSAKKILVERFNDLKGTTNDH